MRLKAKFCVFFIPQTMCLFAWLLAFYLAAASPLLAWAQGTDDGTAEKSTVRVVDIVEVSEPGAALEEPAVAPPPALVRESSDHLEIKVGAHVYRIEDPARGDPARAAYDTMTELEKTSFHINRRLFMSQLARGLNLMKFGFGIGSVVKDKVKYSIQKLRLGRLKAVISRARADEPPHVIYEAPAALVADAPETADPASEGTSLVALEAAREERTRLTLNEKSQRVILGMLKAVDENLWLQAPLFANSNEFGLIAAGGVELIGGKSDRGWGGLVDIGLSLGFNRKEQSLVFQIFTDKERFKSSALPAVFIAGLVFKSGFYIANQRDGVLDHHGTSFYPPLAPAFASITQDNFMAGVSSGLTWPPSPLGDMLTYLDKLDQNTVLRVTVSRLNKGYLRVESGVGSSAFRIVAEPVKKALAYVRSLFKKWTCRDFLTPPDDSSQ